MSMKVVWFIVVGLLAVTGCERRPSQPPATNGASSATNNATTARPVVNTNIGIKDIDPAEAAGQNPDITPVYPEGVDASPQAVKFCEAMWKMPPQRRAACCGGAATSPASLQRCIVALSGALADGAVQVADADVDACVEARAAQLQGCDWVGNLVPAPPAACLGLIDGTLDKGTECRATLECQPGLHCRGAGPTDRGRCAEPGPEGAVCNTGADALAAATRQPARASQCEGWCAVTKCRAALKGAATCKTSLECGSGNHCDGQKCREGLAAEGAACAGGGCEAGLLCYGSECVRPRLSGACSNDLECLGACVDGQCGKRCQRVIAQ